MVLPPAALICCNSDSFVEESEEALNGKELVDLVDAWLALYFEGVAHSSEVKLERGTSIRSD